MSAGSRLTTSDKTPDKASEVRHRRRTSSAFSPQHCNSAPSSNSTTPAGSKKTGSVTAKKAPKTPEDSRPSTSSSSGLDTGDKNKNLRIGFVHLDLGIGGAEQLIVHAACGLQDAGHDVVIYTSFFDPDRCFPGLKLEGAESGSNAKDPSGEKPSKPVRVRLRGSFIPRTIFGKCVVLCSTLRMVYLTIIMFLENLMRVMMRVITGGGDAKRSKSGRSSPRISYDVIVNDQVSAINPLLKLFSKKLLFYCHFPDQLLAIRDDKKLGGILSRLKKLYRRIFDRLELLTTSKCDILCVNSKFTRDVFRETFGGGDKKKEDAGPELHVVYPPVDLTAIDAFLAESSKKPASNESNAPLSASDEKEIAPLGDEPVFFLSLNRYERKKEVHLALEALGKLKSSESSSCKLVIAGGYDGRVEENVSYFAELGTRAKELKLDKRVFFLKSVSNQLRLWLLRNAVATVYTPRNEHFGIVPVESMALKTPVIASDSGGPKESVGKVGGWLVRHSADGFAEAMAAVLKKFENDKSSLDTMGAAARRNVDAQFSLSAFTNQIEDLIRGR